MTGTFSVLLHILAAALAVFFCRALPFFLIRQKDDAASGSAATDNAAPGGGAAPAGGESKGAGGRGRAFAVFLSFVERVVPPVSMTVLALNSIAAPVKEDWRTGIPVLAAAALTLLLQVWRRNYLFSILGGTALYMVLSRPAFF